jgi:hypothetical protein
MGYDQWWKALETLIMELRKKGMSISPTVMTSLRSAKSLIGVYHSDPTCVETLPTIEMDLMNIEAELLNLAKEKVSQKFVQKWMETLERSRREAEPEIDSSTGFITGVPKSDYWIRIHPSPSMPEAQVKRLAKEMGLLTKTQNDDLLVIHGDKPQVKAFVKKMADQIRETSRK